MSVYRLLPRNALYLKRVHTYGYQDDRRTQTKRELLIYMFLIMLNSKHTITLTPNCSRGSSQDLPVSIYIHTQRVSAPRRDLARLSSSPNERIFTNPAISNTFRLLLLAVDTRASDACKTIVQIKYGQRKKLTSNAFV